MNFVAKLPLLTFV